MHVRLTGFALALTALAAPLTAAPAAAAPTAVAAPTVIAVPPAVVFTSDRDGDNELFYRARNGRVVQMTHNDANDFGAVYSPDGRRLAFVSDRDGDTELYVMAATGGRAFQFTRNSVAPDGSPASDVAPAWSPDGQRIAFASNRTGGELEIWVMDADGRNQTRLTTTEDFVFDNEPAFSPDGQFITFTSNRVNDFNVEIFRMRPDGTDVRRLTTTEEGVFDSGAEWSPDGDRIAFSSNRAGRQDSQDLYLMDPDGGNVTPLTAHPDGLDDVFPKWTSDGSQLVFQTFSDPVTGRLDNVWVVDADGTDRRAIVTHPAVDAFPDPRPTSG